MENDKMKYLESQIEALSEKSEVPKQDILDWILNKEKEGYNVHGALQMWKSENRQKLGAGESKEFFVRVVGKGNVRKGSYGDFAYAELLIQDDGIIETKSASFSEDSLSKFEEMLQFNHIYQIQAYMKPDGTLNRVKAIVEVEDNKVPRVEALESFGFVFPKLSDLDSLSGTTRLLHGWVGRVIKTKGSETIIGFELGDETTTLPITCWAGQYSHSQVNEQAQEVREGGELFACVYVSVGSDGNVRGNCQGIFVVN